MQAAQDLQETRFQGPFPALCGPMHQPPRVETRGRAPNQGAAICRAGTNRSIYSAGSIGDD